MKTSLLMKAAVAASVLVGTGAAFAVPVFDPMLPQLTKTTPLHGSFTGLPANAAFSESVSFNVLQNTTGFSALVQTTWSGGLANQMPTFTATLTSLGGFTQPFALTTIPITTVVTFPPALHKPPLTVYVGGIKLLNAIDATLAKGIYELTITGSTKQVSTVSYNMTVTTPLTPIPEPETYALMVAGLGAIGFLARRRKSV